MGLLILASFFSSKAGARTTAEDLETQIVEAKQDREMEDSCSSLTQHHALSWAPILSPLLPDLTPEIILLILTGAMHPQQIASLYYRLK